MPVNIQLLSDLHLEVHPHFMPTPSPGADLLVLAGDIGSYQAGSKLTDSDFGLARFYGDNGQRDIGFGANGRVNGVTTPTCAGRNTIIVGEPIATVTRISVTLRR